MNTAPRLTYSTFLIPLAGIIMMSSCSKKQETAAPQLSETQTSEILNQGNKASAALFGELGPKLKAAMKSGGPEKAITVCKEVAQTNTLDVSNTFSGLALTRVTLKSRNPENQADDFDQKILHQWENQLAEGKRLPDPVVLLKDDTTAVYYKPILAEAICLNCHGDATQFPAGLQKKLSELYPKDQATGHKLGDLRGAFRAEFPIKAQ